MIKLYENPSVRLDFSSILILKKHKYIICFYYILQGGPKK